MERQYQALCESWRVELEDKQKQFEQVKAQILGPRLVGHLAGDAPASCFSPEGAFLTC